MHLVRRVRAWVRAMPFGSPETSGTSCVATLPPEPSPSAPRPSPDIWAAILASARRRRAPRPWPPGRPPAITADDITSRLVGIYLLPPEVRQRARAAARLAEGAHS